MRLASDYDALDVANKVSCVVVLHFSLCIYILGCVLNEATPVHASTC